MNRAADLSPFDPAPGRTPPAETPSPAIVLNRAIERVNVAGEHTSWSAMLPTLQSTGARPSEHDRDRNNRNPGIGRRHYEFVDRVHEPQMENRGGPIIVRGVGKRLEIVARVAFV